ncbi:hypothetical protein ILUMI_09483 [Ignelater luminosus]|uniref:Uncharacterized protein n=1 Tax=Ignelater luminosus TaxID=2038154 RepID=A0A8K0GF03_IGNLU|nr:hypothetical protein ILUMI_09483 [Ignelater luminosus]
MLRAKDPSILVDAIRCLERKELVRYRRRQLPSSTLNQKPTMSQKTYIMPNPTPTQGSSLPSQPINIQPKPVQQKFYTNQQVFVKPKNVFKLGQNVPEELFETEDDTFDDSENQNFQYCVQDFDNMHFENGENEGNDDESTEILNF